MASKKDKRPEWMCKRTRRAATHLAQAEESLRSLAKTKNECPYLIDAYRKTAKLAAADAQKVRNIHRHIGCGTIKKPKRRK
jgi:hypothetical protein